MKNADDLIRALEPEIDLKCAEIKQKKSEKLLTKVFITIALIMLIMPVLLIFCGVSVFTIFIPVIVSGTLFLAASPFLISKGAESYERF